MLQKILHFVLVAGLATLLTTTPVMAHEEPEPRSDQRQASAERIKGKLNENRRKNCETRKAAIANIIGRAAKQGQKHLGTFTAIMERIQGFYTEKALSSTDYDKLVTAADSKKSAAQTAIDTVKASTGLECDGENPIGQVDTFRDSIKAMHRALKDYRVVIKELGQAVKSAHAATQRSAQ